MSEDISDLEVKVILKRKKTIQDYKLHKSFKNRNKKKFYDYKRKTKNKRHKEQTANGH